MIPFAHAEQTDVWNFSAGYNLPEGSQSLTLVQQTPQGLHIQTSSDGFLYWLNPLLHKVDVLSLDVINQSGIDAALLWHPAGAPEGQLQYYFYIPPSPTKTTVHLALTDIRGWDWRSDQFALGFPAGTNVIVSNMTWRRFSTWEKVTEAWKGFWTFDVFRPYSINFLWGPLLPFNPVARDTLFERMPPPSWSADRLFYLAIGISIAVGLLFYVFDRVGGKKILIYAVGGSVVAIWVLFDLRMGAEIIGYAVTDYQKFVAPPAAQKTLRTHENFYSIAEKLLPTIKKFDQFVVVGPTPSPYYANLRYMAYPSVGMNTDADTSGATLWAIIKRPDIKVNGQRLVADDGTVIAGSGTVIERYDAGSFLYHTP